MTSAAALHLNQPMPSTPASTTERVNVKSDRLLPVAEAPVWESTDRPPVVWLVGAHGGAGTTTLATSWAPAAEAGRVWPAADKYPYVVIVCRSHLAGLERAHELALQAKGGLAGDCQLLGVAVVADAPVKLPKTLRQKIEVIGAAVSHLWEIPWLPALRETTLTELPEWNPQDGPAKHQTRHPLHRARIAPMTQVDQHLAYAGEGIFKAARNAHSLHA